MSTNSWWTTSKQPHSTRPSSKQSVFLKTSGKIYRNRKEFQKISIFFRTISDETSLTFVTMANPPTSISLESSSIASLTVKWDHSSLGPGTSVQKFKLSIENSNLNYSAEYSVSGDKNTFNFSKLPDVAGAGK